MRPPAKVHQGDAESSSCIGVLRAQQVAEVVAPLVEVLRARLVDVGQRRRR
jgi:hypothetical protein